MTEWWTWNDFLTPSAFFTATEWGHSGHFEGFSIRILGFYGPISKKFRIQWDRYEENPIDFEFCIFYGCIIYFIDLNLFSLFFFLLVIVWLWIHPTFGFPFEVVFNTIASPSPKQMVSDVHRVFPNIPDLLQVEYELCVYITYLFIWLLGILRVIICTFSPFYLLVYTVAPQKYSSQRFLPFVFWLL